MPYVRVSTLPLDLDTKRRLADELTATVLDVLPEERPEWTSVHFTPFDAESFATGSRLVSDGAPAHMHLELAVAEIDERAWFALRNRLTDVLADQLNIADADRFHINVKLSRYELHDVAFAGNAGDAFDATGAVMTDAPARSGPGWLRPAAWLGFALGAILSYRWISDRVATDAIVDVAAPVHGSAATPAAAE
jgi:phenylpyruvate tautomerase PptA (4-oxalocrotonate tautomerase family)